MKVDQLDHSYGTMTLVSIQHRMKDGLLLLKDLLEL